MAKDGPSRPPYMLFFAKDWLAKTAGLSVLEEGCYMRLTVVARVQSDDWCSVQDDDRKNAMLCNISQRHWKRVRGVLVPDYCFEESGRLVFPRLREEAERQLLAREQQSRAGQQSARVRAQRAFNVR